MLGLDIGTKTIKFVELDKSGGQWKLKASGIVGHNALLPDKIQEDKELLPLAEAIKKLHKEAKISTKQVCISLPEPQVFTRSIRFPLLTDAEIASAVKWEAEQYIPIPVNEAVVQHQVIEKRQDTTPPQAVVLLVATPKQLVEKYSKVVDMAGLSLVVVETELMSLVRSLAPPDQTVMVIDFGSSSTDIAIANSGQLVFSRSISTAGDAFTRAVGQGLGIELQQAEEYKRTYGLSANQLEGKIKTSLDPIFRVVLEEIKKAMHFYQSEGNGSIPGSILLAGGTSAMPEISTTMTKALGVEVVVGNPFSKINVDPQALSTLTQYAPLYSVAVGLAMREV